MGVRFLQTFVCKDVPNGYFQINIGQEIIKWKRNNAQSTPLIVFDVMGLLSIKLQSNISIVLGGRHHIILSKYDEFFRTLKEHGVELIFFCDGRTQKNKADVWIDRQNKKYLQTISILDKIDESAGCLDFIDNMKRDDMPGLTTIIYGLMNICRKHGEVRLTMNVECDTELSRFATMNNAVSVIADDTDFLIYEGDWKFWSARNINIGNLTTMEYSRSALRIALGLAPKQLPILATLAGNDIVHYDSVKPFHRRLRLSYHNRFYSLAQYIRFNPINVNDLSYAIFQSTENSFLNLVRESLSLYNINYETSKETDLLIQKSEFDTCFYTFFNGWPYNITLSFFDMRRMDFLSYNDIVMPIVKRQIGFVRKQKNDHNYQQVIITKMDSNQPYKETRISPEYPSFLLPDLLDITFDQNKEHLHPLRFDLLEWLIFGCGQYFKIQNIPIEYMVLLSTLKFLLSINQVTEQEADALLACVHKVRQNKVPLEISPGNVTTRSIIVSHLYSKMHNIILNCFKLVGLEKFVDQLIFDGPYFTLLLKNFRSTSREEYENTMVEIQSYRNYLYS